MIRHIIALAALIATPAWGQAYDHPDWTDGSVPARDWGTVSTSADAPTGSAPADTYEPADITETVAETGWVVTADQTDYVTTAGAEKKFRVLCEPGTAKHLDPILARGVPPPALHRHQGIGNVGWDENTTWNTLRSSPSSTCSGGPMNGVIYWEPEMLKPLATGAVAGVRPQDVTFYYVGGIIGEANDHTWLRRNFRFIGGANPTNYNDTARRAEYSAAGLVYPGSPDTPAGFTGYQCYAGSNLNVAVTVSVAGSRMKYPNGTENTGMARHLKNESGQDPWGGNCTGSDATPGAIILNLIAPDCWDRHNLGAPDGRGHVAYKADTASNTYGSKDACPTVVVDGVRQKYGRVPALITKTTFMHAGFTDYGTWYLSSDRMNSAVTPGDATSLDPCRQTGPYFCPGSTAHFDWWNGWRSNIADEWQRECLGISVRGVSPVNGPAECNASQISHSRKMIIGGASPDPSLSGGCTAILSCSNAVPGNIQRYNPLATGTEGTFTGHGH